MKLQAFKNRNGVIIFVCVVVIILIYSIDLFKLSYRTADWKEFGNTPIKATHVQYFVADTPNLIGYKELDTGEMISCAVTVAYLQTDAQETFRCCDTGEKISCLAGDFAKEIPPADEICTNKLKNAFGIPETQPGVVDYQVFGDCPSGSGITMAEIDSNGQILWKFFDASRITALVTILRCALGPALLALVAWILFSTARAQTNKPIRRDPR